MVNNFTLMGRLTKVPELRAYADGKYLTAFSIAVNENKEKVHFFDLTAFGKTGEFVHHYFGKGQMIAVQGHLNYSTWTGQDGKTKSAVQLIADKADFCGDGKVREQNTQVQQAVQQAQTNIQSEWTTAPNEMPMDDMDQLPF